MKKILLNGDLPYYKANLHCHSTISDGTKSPAELKEFYKQNGYSVIAYTDHDVLLDHSDLCDETFVALNGYEMEINENKPQWSASKTCHMCYIALDQKNLTQVCYHRTNYLFAHAPEHRAEIRFDESKPDFVREYTPACINEMIAEGRKNGFFVTYNHPNWSLETYDDYTTYHGMNAMEICNYGCVEAGYPDYNEKEYDDMLRGGEKIFCIATDDNHNYRNDSFGGFTCINAKELTYSAIADALSTGNFYASQAPLIKHVWYEDGKIGIECDSSNIREIRLNTGIRRTENACDKNLTSAVFNVEDTDVYVRLTVTDENGKNANTNAYFVKDLMRVFPQEQ